MARSRLRWIDLLYHHSSPSKERLSPPDTVGNLPGAIWRLSLAFFLPPDESDALLRQEGQNRVHRPPSWAMFVLDGIRSTSRLAQGEIGAHHGAPEGSPFYSLIQSRSIEKNETGTFSPTSLLRSEPRRKRPILSASIAIDTSRLPKCQLLLSCPSRLVGIDEACRFGSHQDFVTSFSVICFPFLATRWASYLVSSMIHDFHVI